VIQIFKLLYVLILWILSQGNFSSPCRFAGFEADVCSGMCVPTGFVCHCAFILEKVCCEDLSICHFQRKRERERLEHVYGEEVNPKIMECRMTFKLF